VTNQSLKNFHICTQYVAISKRVKERVMFHRDSVLIHYMLRNTVAFEVCFYMWQIPFQ